MNLPNKLTLIRVMMIPLFLLFLFCGIAGEYGRLISVIIFVLASLTDALDGYIARKFDLITNFGKFMDPLADKLLVCSALIALVELGELPAVVTIIIIAREFIITGFRLVASDNGVVIAASVWGKAKTISQMAMVVYLLAGLTGGAFEVIGGALIIISVCFTVVSAVDYIVKNIGVLKI